MTKRLAFLALAGAALLSFAPAAGADACSLAKCVDPGCIWIDTFPICPPV